MSSEDGAEHKKWCEQCEDLYKKFESGEMTSEEENEYVSLGCAELNAWYWYYEVAPVVRTVFPLR
jgi:hypothetical protein